MSDAMLLFLYVMTEFGFVYVIGNSTITLALRTTLHDGPGPLRVTRQTIVKLIECPACLGFHVGWIVGAATGLGPWLAIGLGFFTSGVNVVLGKLTRLMD